MIEVHRTTQAVASERLLSQLPIEFGPAPGFHTPSVQVDDHRRFQTIEGFGGAFTEAAAVTFQKLAPEKQQRFLTDYFDPVHGHGYTLGRMHINSCDFSLGNWACCDTPGDTELKTFPSSATSRQSSLCARRQHSTRGGRCNCLRPPGVRRRG